MKKMLLIAGLCAVSSLYAQPKLPAKLRSLKSAPSIKSDIEKVVRDIFLGFDNVIGDTLMQTANSVSFYSKIIPAGAKNCLVTKYGYPDSRIWQGTMYEGEEFEEAVGKYRGFYKQLAGSSITLYDRTTYKLTGEYDHPDEDRAFASSILQFADAKDHIKSLKVEIALNYSFPEWKVSVLVYQKVSDDELRPTVTGKSF